MKLVAVLPTYNEAGNIEPLVEELLALDERLEVVVVDDDSPDGTWRLVAAMQEKLPRVHLVHRKTERGRGSAGIAGFIKALEVGADWVIEMDADYSHHPRFLAPMFVRAGVIIGNEGEKPEQTADIVVGSRLIAGGGEEGRNLARTIITWGANIYLRLLLRLPIRDCTTGYRLFSGDMLRRYNWSAFESNGPAIVQELLLAGQALGARMVEVPILFEPRREGESTFNLKIALAGLVRPLRMRLRGGRILVQTDK